MGPATLRLVEGRYRAVRTTSPSARRPADRPERLIILERAGGRELKAATLSELKVGIVVDGIRVRLTNRFRHAVVTDNKIGEDPTGGGPPNPALELNLEKAGQAQRDVVYAKYPEFSLNKAGSFGLAFRYEAPDLIQMNSNGVSAANATTGNTIQFHFERGQPKTVQVVLLKNGVFVAEKIMSEGDAFTTPWMGMTIFLGSIIQGSESVTKITPVKPKPGSELPPSAVLVRTSGSQKPFWLALGERAPAQIGGRAAFVAFQNEMIELPFKLTLEKFSKVDYPGTQTAMSYESRVRLSRDGSVHTISMNEPLKEAGYTLYQASYMLSPDSPPVTVLSVNRDPGRPIKYAGSVILSIGIVMFTLMRSRVMRARQRTEAK